MTWNVQLLSAASIARTKITSALVVDDSGRGCGVAVGDGVDVGITVAGSGLRAIRSVGGGVDVGDAGRFVVRQAAKRRDIKKTIRMILRGGCTSDEAISTDARPLRRKGVLLAESSLT